MHKILLSGVLLTMCFSCSEEAQIEEQTINNDFEPKIISANSDSKAIVNNEPAALTEIEVIENELVTELPNTFSFKSVSPQNPGTGVIESKLYEFVEPGNQEVTFFFIKTIYETKDQSIDTHYDAIVNGPRVGSDRKFLEKIVIGDKNWLYEKYEMNEPDGTPVMYDDFIYIDQDIMYGMIVCCNSDVYPKWESVIVNAKDKLVVR